MLVVQLVKNTLFMKAQQCCIGRPVNLFSGIHNEQKKSTATRQRDGCALRDVAAKVSKGTNTIKVS
jgi:hypothetical protein